MKRTKQAYQLAENDALEDGRIVKGIDDHLGIVVIHYKDGTEEHVAYCKLYWLRQEQKEAAK